MCGIIAITGKKTDKIQQETVEAMLSCLSKRGPDEKAFVRLPGAVLGQTRLSIIDLADGHQPMRDNTRPLTIVFNGEIYGYKEVRQDLEKKGHRFSTASDTEVILKAYSQYGRECPKRIDGMFAFAIWDEEKGELFVARDRFGKKPLYYSFADDTVFLASEIKSLFAAGVRGAIDPGSLDDYLRLGYIPSRKSVYSNVHALPPAHAAVFKGGTAESWKYWSIEKKPMRVSYDEAKTRIRQLFDEAVRKRMVADVEIGSLLSGGVDSTLVTAYAQRHSSSPIKTFSVDYEGAKTEQPFALEASRKIGTDHHTLSVSADLAHELENIVRYMDEPHADSSNFPQALVSKLAASKVKVALTGDGADELFMGYGWYQKHINTPRWKLSRIFDDAFIAQQKEITVFNDSERSRLLLKKGASDQARYEKILLSDIRDPIEKINRFDLDVYLSGQLLAKIDRTSMMHSLEIRSPFLDTALAEYVFNLPTEFKISKTNNKLILKDILTEIFSKEFAHRRKQGFGAPVAEWLESANMRKLVSNLIASDSPMFKYIDRASTKAIMDAFYGGDRRAARKLWTLACLALWFNLHPTNA